MVKLEGTIKRFIGLSTDAKPASTLDDVIPVGSSFMETNTGKIFRFDGQVWTYGTLTDDSAQLLTMIYLQLEKLVTIAEAVSA